MDTPTKATGSKTSKPRSGVLGRSPATGLLVLAPATKPGAISLEAAMRAAETVNGARKA